MNTKRLIFSFMMLAVALTAMAQRRGGDYAKMMEEVKKNYTKQEVMIPMRDGVKLHTSIYTPTDSTERHPILMLRTAYQVSRRFLWRLLSGYRRNYCQQYSRTTDMSKHDFLLLLPQR